MKAVSVKIIIIVALFYSCNHHPDPKIASLPPFGIMLNDSETVVKTQQFPKGKSLLLIYFSPDCPHCNREADTLIKNIQLFDHSLLYFLTSASFADINRFASAHSLLKYNNVKIGKDLNHEFWNTFHPSIIPYIAIYDSQQKLVKVFHGEVELNSIRKLIKG